MSDEETGGAVKSGEKPLNELLSRSLVDLYVGESSKQWILHEKLICHYSPFFRQIFYDTSSSNSKSKSYGLPDFDDVPFELFVGWLYSRSLQIPMDEKDIGPLLDLYLMSEQFEIESLSNDVVEAVRSFYYSQNTYPGLRRVQYIYANTESDNAMREMMVSSIARFLTLSETIPAHWDRALANNGRMAVDIIRAIQEWHLESRSVPDPRDGEYGRKFAPIEEGVNGDGEDDIKGDAMEQ